MYPRFVSSVKLWASGYVCSYLQPREFQSLSWDLSGLSYGMLAQNVSRCQMTMRWKVDNQLQSNQSLRGQNKVLSDVRIHPDNHFLSFQLIQASNILGYLAKYPPSTGKQTPVTYEELSDESHNEACATSWAIPKRCKLLTVGANASIVVPIISNAAADISLYFCVSVVEMLYYCNIQVNSRR